MPVHRRNVVFVFAFALALLLTLVGLGSPYWDQRVLVHYGLFAACYGSVCGGLDGFDISAEFTAAKSLSIGTVVLALNSCILLIVWAAGVSHYRVAIAGKAIGLSAGLLGITAAAIFPMDQMKVPEGWAYYLMAGGSLWMLVQSSVGFCVRDPSKNDPQGSVVAPTPHRIKVVATKKRVDDPSQPQSRFSMHQGSGVSFLLQQPQLSLHRGSDEPTPQQDPREPIPQQKRFRLPPIQHSALPK